MRQPKLLIANRGEIAVRVIRTCRELGIHSVAVYSDADRNALHVEMADSAYHIGPASPAESYLSIGAILEAARKSKATLIHPGYGFLSERAHFSQAVADAGLTFVGPSADSIERMGDKMSARRTADAAGVPITPGTVEPVDPASAMREAKTVGFPMVVKAAFGGGGKGMRVVNEADELEEALEGAGREALAYFGRPEIYMERYIERAHHIEAQIIADTHGNVFFLGERDCTLQRRHQKLVEETPSPLVDDEMRARLEQAAISLAKETGYVNAGTIECIADEDGNFYFMEMNTRLQVEHTVTELVTGYDLVALQIQVALGERLELAPDPRGHAIQCRLNAEDPLKNFQPGPGHVAAYDEPGGPFVRIDSGIVAGKEVPADYDSMFAKLVTWGADREQARRRMLRALGEFHVQGIPTTIPFHRWVLDTPEFIESTHTTAWVERALAEDPIPTPTETPVIVGPIAGPKDPIPSTITVEVAGRRVPVKLWDERLPTAPPPPAQHVAHHGEHVHDVISAPMQGTILRVAIESGQELEAGDVICVLEAMKMENHIVATRDGTVTEVPIAVGQVVDAGQTLAVID
ncbi:MAG: biotin carboxylase N-terminal domain-containing protein [Actinomycetota bacterium]